MDERGLDLGTRVDPVELPGQARIDLLLQLEERRRAVEAAQLRVLAAIGAEDRTRLGSAAEEVSLALQIPVQTAQRRLAEARTLVGELPRMLAAVEAGTVSPEQARVVTEGLWKLPPTPGLAARLEQAVLPKLQGGCVAVPRLRRIVSRAVLALDPGTAEQRHQRALADRTVRYAAGGDGLAWLSILLDAPDAQLIHARLTAAAGALAPQDVRTLDQQRADLFVDAVLSGLPVDGLPEVRGRKPAIQVLVSADTLLGLDERPAELAGYGPITAATARQLAADESGTWRRLLTDPDTGALLDISAGRYRPPQRLRDFVSARDGRCVFPTCEQPGYRCEYDHTVPFLAGGRTTRANGALACRRHNNLKAIGSGWRYRHNRDGSYTWTTPTGRTYRRPGLMSPPIPAATACPELEPEPVPGPQPVAVPVLGTQPVAVPGPQPVVVPEAAPDPPPF